MRKTTKSVVGLISLGVFGASWSLGQAAETGIQFTDNVSAGSSSSETTNTAAPTDTASPQASSTPAASESTAPVASSTPTATPKAATQSKASTKTSDAISYVAHRASGTMQLKVTKAGGKITAITVVSGGTEGSEWAQAPAILVQAAIKAQGSNFGNLSNATHTTDAFKEALDNALAKF